MKNIIPIYPEKIKSGRHMRAFNGKCYTFEKNYYSLTPSRPTAKSACRSLKESQCNFLKNRLPACCLGKINQTRAPNRKIKEEEMLIAIL